jgi:hypothetical protein
VPNIITGVLATIFTKLPPLCQAFLRVFSQQFLQNCLPCARHYCRCSRKNICKIASLEPGIIAVALATIFAKLPPLCQGLLQVFLQQYLQNCLPCVRHSCRYSRNNICKIASLVPGIFAGVLTKIFTKLPLLCQALLRVFLQQYLQNCLHCARYYCGCSRNNIRKITSLVLGIIADVLTTIFAKLPPLCYAFLWVFSQKYSQNCLPCARHYCGCSCDSTLPM